MLGVGVAIALAGGAAASDDGAPWRHRLPDRAIALDADPTLVALLHITPDDEHEPDGDSTATLHREVERAGGFARRTDLIALPQGWSLWERTLPPTPGPTPEATPGPDGQPRGDWSRDQAGSIDRLLAIPGVGFATPLLIGEDAGWRLPTPDLLIGIDTGAPGRPDAPAADDAVIAAVLAELGLPPEAIVPWRVPGLERVLRVRTTSRDGATLLRLADRLADLDGVRFAEPDFLMAAFPGGAPVSDPQFPSQWGLHNTGQSTLCGGPSATVDIDVNAPEAWSLVQADPSMIVLVLDNGVQFDHPDLVGDPTLGFDPTPDAGGGWPVGPCDNHGTAVVGVLAAKANNGTGIAGLAHGVRFASARVAISAGACGVWTAQSSWIAEALAWGESIGATISNTSWAFLPSAAVTEAYAQRAANGMLHIASSHNLGLPSIAYPANLPTVIAVGAVGRQGNLATFSNWGDEQEVVAPGTQVRTTDRTGSDGYGSGNFVCLQGTSFAAPLVTATAVLVRTANPALDPETVRSLLQAATLDLGPPGWDPLFGHGLIRADLAVLGALALAPSIADLDGDGVVDGADLGILLSLWATGAPLADLNGDGVVDGADLGVLLSLWGA